MKKYERGVDTPGTHLVDKYSIGLYIEIYSGFLQYRSRFSQYQVL